MYYYRKRIQRLKPFYKLKECKKEKYIAILENFVFNIREIFKIIENAKEERLKRKLKKIRKIKATTPSKSIYKLTKVTKLLKQFLIQLNKLRQIASR